MLIKSNKLIKKYTPHLRTDLDTGEMVRETQQEIRRAKQEASVIKHEAENVLRESQEKLKQAEAKAKEIIDEADKLKEKLHAETIQAAKKEAEGIKQQAREILESLFTVKREALNQAHGEIIKVALDLAEKIIRYQASIDPNVLKTQVMESIKRATTEADRVQVFVNPIDLDLLKQSIIDMEKLFPSGIDIVPLSNDSIDQGSCIVETKSGQLDARFSTQLKALTSLVTSIDLPKPQINVQVQEEDKPKHVLKEEPVVDENLTNEEQISKDELLREETPPFVQENEIEEVIQQEVSEEAPAQKRKKLFTGGLAERTKEEIDELDEDKPDEEFKEDKENEKITPKSILKPKKKLLSTQVTNIAQEVEQNPDWKDLVQEEDEE